MINYMKSEWYRITHTKDLYLLTGILAGLALILNFDLFMIKHFEEAFSYATVSFSLSIPANALDLLFWVGFIIVSILFSHERRNGILKNAVAGGISREKIFIGKCIVCTGASICSLVVILLVYIGSAVLLLEPGVCTDAVLLLLEGVACVLIAAAAYEILALALIGNFKKEIVAMILWWIIMQIIPTVCALLGLKFELLEKLAAWMPYNYLRTGSIINMGGWDCMWSTPEGVAKCLISGIIGLVIFLLAGLGLCRRQEV